MRGLTVTDTQPRPADPAWATTALRRMDARLRQDSSRPVAVGLSGGGDSVALALLARQWTTAHGRPLHLLSVDHGLSPHSAAWTEACRRLAARLEAEFQPLRWEGEKPASGLPAAARAARHRLLAEAARTAGASVVLLGHTADDVAETEAMRAAGATTPRVREWGPSPAWPEGRGVFLLRPLLTAGRAEIRAWLTAGGEPWIEDPANEDLRFARARARRAAPGPFPEPRPTPDRRPLARQTRMDAGGVLRLPRAAVGEDGAASFLGVACLCAAGTNHPPRAAAVERLLTRLRAPGAVTATLAGARLEADADELRIFREPGEAARGGLSPMSMPPGSAVWDGRFEIASDRPLTIVALAGFVGRLEPPARAALSALPPRARGALPAVVEDGRVVCLAPAAPPGVAARPLAYERLLATCGIFDRET